MLLRLAALALAACSVAACRSAGPPQVVRPGAPGSPSEIVPAEEVAHASAEPVHTEADVRFMQEMIAHHAQAIEMTELLKTRSSNPDMQKLAHRIEISQRDEIEMMREWLRQRGAPVPDPHAHHAPGGKPMPGMLTPEEVARLAAAKGPEFDRLFLEAMIRHHQGALVMVDRLFDEPGAGQEAEIFAFAADVEADQLIEIRRMGIMLKELKDKER